MPDIPLHALEEIPFGKIERRFLEILLRLYPNSITISRLVDKLWIDDPNGGPNEAAKSVQVHRARINKKLTPVGWTIHSINLGRGGAFYSLRKLDETRPI